MRLAAATALAVLCLGSPAQAQEDDAFGGLPPGEGRELVYGTCTACHSTAIIRQQGMTRARWDSTLTWMVEQQGMPDPPPDMRATILDYLAEQFPAERKGGPTGGTPGMLPAPGLRLAPLPLPGR